MVRQDDVGGERAQRPAKRRFGIHAAGDVGDTRRAQLQLVQLRVSGDVLDHEDPDGGGQGVRRARRPAT